MSAADKNIHSFKLIEGSFEPTEAGKVLMALISSKINYHNMEAFSNRERFSKDLSHSEKRVEELKKVNEALKKIIEDAAQKGQHFIINGVIEIEVSG